MKKTNLTLVLISIFLLSSSFRFKTQTNSGDLTVTIDHFSSNKGKAIVNLFKKGDDVTKEPFKQLSGKIANGVAEVVFKDLPYGDYAILMWHDQNSNGDLDHSWGIPAEPMGYSRGWSFSLFSGMPTFDKLKFEFSNQKNTCIIHLKK